MGLTHRSCTDAHIGWSSLQHHLISYPKGSSNHTQMHPCPKEIQRYLLINHFIPRCYYDNRKVRSEITRCCVFSSFIKLRNLPNNCETLSPHWVCCRSSEQSTTLNSLTVFLPIICEIIAIELMRSVDPPIPSRAVAPYTAWRYWSWKSGRKWKYTL